MDGPSRTFDGDEPEGLDPRASFSLDPVTPYLDAATYGLLPTATSDAMHAALEAMASGTGPWVKDRDHPAESSRADLAALCGLPESSVALLPALSVGAGLVAASLGPHDRAVVPVDEFTSLMFPLLVARERGTTVREVPSRTFRWPSGRARRWWP